MKIDKEISQRSSYFWNTKGSTISVPKNPSNFGSPKGGDLKRPSTQFQKFKGVKLEKSRNSKSTETLASSRHTTLGFTPNYTMKQFKAQLKEDLSVHLWKDKRQIRKMLHPTLEEQFLPSQDNYIPGLLNLKKSDSTKSIKVKVSPKFYSRKKEFDSMPQYNFDIPAIRNSNPYMETQKVERIWVNGDNFKTYFGKASTSQVNYIQNYVTRDPSEPPLLHKFRDKNKDKWIGGDFKW